MRHLPFKGYKKDRQPGLSNNNCNCNICEIMQSGLDPVRIVLTHDNCPELELLIA